jgi:hypothetical protein
MWQMAGGGRTRPLPLLWPPFLEVPVFKVRRTFNNELIDRPVSSCTNKYRYKMQTMNVNQIISC